MKYFCSSTIIIAMKKNEKYNLSFCWVNICIPTAFLRIRFSPISLRWPKNWDWKVLLWIRLHGINYVFYDDDQHAQSYNFIDRIPPGNLNLVLSARGRNYLISLLQIKLIFRMEDRLASIDRKLRSVNHLFLTVAYSQVAATFNRWLAQTGFLVFFLPCRRFWVYLLVSFHSKFEYLSLHSRIGCFLYGDHYCRIDFCCFSWVECRLSIISAIITFVPGLSLTIALEEITSKNLVSGTAKLFDAIISLLSSFLV